MEGSPKVLLVDDEPDILSSFKALLRKTEAEVLTAANADEAEAILRAEEIRLVVSDFRMPGRDGLALLAVARDVQPNAVRVLMTAFPELDLAVRAINDSRIESFFVKPLDPAFVVQTIQSILQASSRQLLREQAFARAMSMRGEK